MEFESIIAVINFAKQTFDLDTVTTMLLDSEARQKTFISNSVTQAHYTSTPPPFLEQARDPSMAVSTSSHPDRD